MSGMNKLVGDTKKIASSQLSLANDHLKFKD